MADYEREVCVSSLSAFYKESALSIVDYEMRGSRISSICSFHKAIALPMNHISWRVCTPDLSPYYWGSCVYFNFRGPGVAWRASGQFSIWSQILFALVFHFCSQCQLPFSFIFSHIHHLFSLIYYYCFSSGLADLPLTIPLWLFFSVLLCHVVQFFLINSFSVVKNSDFSSVVHSFFPTGISLWQLRPLSTSRAVVPSYLGSWVMSHNRTELQLWPLQHFLSKSLIVSQALRGPSFSFLFPLPPIPSACLSFSYFWVGVTAPLPTLDLLRPIWLGCCSPSYPSFFHSFL